MLFLHCSMLHTPVWHPERLQVMSYSQHRMILSDSSGCAAQARCSGSPGCCAARWAAAARAAWRWRRSSRRARAGSCPGQASPRRSRRCPLPRTGCPQAKGKKTGRTRQGWAASRGRPSASCRCPASQVRLGLGGCMGHALIVQAAPFHCQAAGQEEEKCMYQCAPASALTCFC